jgi:hypothetical protein
MPKNQIEASVTSTSYIEIKSNEQSIIELKTRGSVEPIEVNWSRYK